MSGSDDPELFLTMAQAERFARAVALVHSGVGPTRLRLRAFLLDLADLVGPGVEFSIYLFAQVTRQPVPLIIDNITAGPTYTKLGTRPTAQVQKIADISAHAVHRRLPELLRALRTPMTYVHSQNVDPAWYEEIGLQKILRPLGFEDAVVSDWITPEARGLTLHVLSKLETGPLTTRHCAIVSLIMRIVGPIVEQQLLRQCERDFDRLSAMQRAALLSVLTGESAGELTARLLRIVGFGPEHVEAVLRFYQVKTEEELRRKFYDRSAISDLENDVVSPGDGETTRLF
jgi:hypothetical protein